MNNPKLTISVVITCYNYDQYVGLAIDSVLSQTRPADELIVLDDGSTDNSRAVISAYGDRIKTVFKQNEGNKETVNRGFRESRGTVVLFLDADDILYDRALEKVEQAWRDDAAKVQYDLDVIDGAGEKTGRKFCNFSSEISVHNIAEEFDATGTYIWPVMSGNAYARRFLEQVLPMMSPVGHDGVLNTIAPLYGSVITIRETLGQYRLHGRNMSLSDSRGKAKRHPDFPRQIGFRFEEFEILRQHAQRRAIALPEGNLLDNELVFVNYRLMAIKIGQSYVGRDADTRMGLWKRGVALGMRQKRNFKARLANILWLTTLLVAPAPVARGLIGLRFNRAGHISAARRLFNLRPSKSPSLGAASK